MSKAPEHEASVEAGIVRNNRSAKLALRVQENQNRILWTLRIKAIVEDVVSRLWEQVHKFVVGCVLGGVEGTYDPIIIVFEHGDEPVLRCGFEEGFDDGTWVLCCDRFGHCAWLFI